MTYDHEAIERADREYLEWVAHFCRGLTVAPGTAAEVCGECESDGEEYNEGSFSWSDCDSCGSTLGGDRHPAHGIVQSDGDTLPKGTIIHMSICVDCLMYHANGETPGRSLYEWRQSPYVEN